MRSVVEIYRTSLGDTVSRRTDGRDEHIVLEVRPHGAEPALAIELDLVPAPSGLSPYEEYNL